MSDVVRSCQEGGGDEGGGEVRCSRSQRMLASFQTAGARQFMWFCRLRVAMLHFLFVVIDGRMCRMVAMAVMAVTVMAVTVVAGVRCWWIECRHSTVHVLTRQ